MKALLNECVIAPNAVALLDLFHARIDTLLRGMTYDLAERIVQHHFTTMRPGVEKGLLGAVKSRNGPLVEHLVTTYKPIDRRDYGALLCTAIETNDETFVLRFIGLSVEQAFLASLEAAFEPCFIRRVAAHQKPRKWLAQVVVRNMDAVVAIAAASCPLVTADVAFAHCAVTPTDASKYAHLCARRDLLNHQIEAFYQAIQAGNVGIVGNTLVEVPALRRSSMDTGVTALMASSLAPNSIALLECLRQLDATIEAVHVALLHACRHGAAAASIDFLWNWVETFKHHQRVNILWGGIWKAMSHEHLAGVNALLPYVREWSLDQAPNLLILAMTTTSNDKFVHAVMDLPATQSLFKWLDAKMAPTGPKVGPWSRGSGACACGFQICSCAENAQATVSGWVDRALHSGMQLVAGWLEKRWPDLIRRHAFIRCNSELTNDAAVWSELSQQYVRDMTWHHTRAAYLVQRRFLPGLDHLGRHIATYLYGFDAHNEYKTLTYRDPRPKYRQMYDESYEQFHG